MPAGRRSELVKGDKVGEAILGLITAGNFRQVAAQAAGVTPRTLARWMARGKKESSGPYFEFRQALLRAEQEGHIRMLALVTAGAQKDPRFACWYLERKHSELYGAHAGELKTLRAEQTKLSAMIEGILGGTLADFASLQKRLRKLEAENAELRGQAAEARQTEE